MQLELWTADELYRLADPAMHVLTIARARWEADPSIGPAVQPHLVALVLAQHTLQHARDLPAALAAAYRVAAATIALGEAARVTLPPTWTPPPRLRSGVALMWPPRLPLTKAQRLGVVVGVHAPVELARVATEQLHVGRRSGVCVENAGPVPIILEQRGRPPRAIAPGTGSGVMDLHTAYLRAEAPGGLARVRVVSR